jgi:glycosyltransferase involved in cell wall biosynthesis
MAAQDHMDGKNVLFFIFRLHGGGAERVVSNLSIDLAGKYNIRIAVFDKLDKQYLHQGELIKINTPYSDDPAGNGWFIRSYRLWFLVRELRRIKRLHRIDTAISFGEQANIVNLLAGGKGRTILSVRTLLSTEMKSAPKMGVLRAFIKNLYNRADQIVVPSKMAGEDLSRHFNVLREKIKVIYNYIEPARISAAAEEKLEDPLLEELFSRPILLNVGRITPAKGQWLLLEMMPKILERYPDWKLVIIGEAEKKEKLMRQLVAKAQQLGLDVYDGSGAWPTRLDAHVYFLGYQPNPYRYMRRSRLLLFPSVFEGFPNTLLEAMQTGLPVIAADCQSGPREIMAPDSDLLQRITKKEITPYGILCPPLATANIFDEIPFALTAEWLSALFMVLDDNDLRQSMIRNGLQRVKDFDKQTILRSWQESLA